MSDDDRPLTVGEFKLLMEAHEARENDSREVLLKACLAGYPGGDAAAHCQYHQAKIDAAKEEAEYWKAAKIKLVEGGASTLVLVFRSLMWLSLLAWFFKLGISIPDFLKTPPAP